MGSTKMLKPRRRTWVLLIAILTLVMIVLLVLGFRRWARRTQEAHLRREVIVSNSWANDQSPDHVPHLDRERS